MTRVNPAGQPRSPPARILLPLNPGDKGGAATAALLFVAIDRPGKGPSLDPQAVLGAVTAALKKPGY